jgi:hypothetical protein
MADLDEPARTVERNRVEPRCVSANEDPTPIGRIKNDSRRGRFGNQGGELALPKAEGLLIVRNVDSDMSQGRFHTAIRSPPSPFTNCLISRPQLPKASSPHHKCAYDLEK